MWIVAKISPYVWRETQKCADCQAIENCSYELCHFDEDCNNCDDTFDVTNLFNFDEDNNSSTGCSCDEREGSLAWSENDFSITNSFWFGIGSLMQQESDLYIKVGP